MGKVKKGKKVDHEEDDVDEPTESERNDAELTSKSKTKKEKKLKEKTRVSESDSEDKNIKNKKGKKGSDGNDVEELSGEIKELSIGSKKKAERKKSKSVSIDSEEEVRLNQISKEKSKSKKSKKKGVSTEDSEGESGGDGDGGVGGGGGGFSVLAMSDDEGHNNQNDDDNDDIDDEPVEVAPKDLKKEKGGKKGKKKKKDDDEDLDAILAELELEYSGVAPKPAAVTETEAVPDETELAKKMKKKEKKERRKEAAAKEQEVGEDGEVGEEAEGDESTVKSAAQKRKEKKEREKQKKAAEKAKTKETTPKDTKAGTPQPEPAPEELRDEEMAEDEDDDDDKKKKKKKKGGKEEKEKEKKGAPSKKVVAAMKEHLKKLKEEEEKRQKEEEERLRKEEEAEKLRQEQIRLEQEKRERRKAKEKEKKERLKAEGKLLTPKQKADKERALAMIEAMKAMYAGAAVPPAKPRSGKTFVAKPKKKKPSEGGEQGEEGGVERQLERNTSTESEVGKSDINEETKEVEIVDETEEEPKLEKEPEVEPIKDSWDAESSDEDDKSEESGNKETADEPQQTTAKQIDPKEVKAIEEVDDDESSDEGSDESGSESESESSEDEPGEKKTDAEKKREKAIARIKERQMEAERKKTLDELRAAVVCVLGHVDTGKTKILDKLRRTNVQDSEAGGITQQIGATNVPVDAIKEQTKHVKGFSQMDIKVPGLLIIDTPGHESFSNLRSRGSSLCDIAILVVDIMHGLEPQTIESINLLKQRKTPFIVALNKIDRLYDWQTMARKDIRDILKAQSSNTQLQFEQKTKEVVLQFAEQGLNAALFYDNPDTRSYLSLVPTSAITGEGMGNLLSLIVEYSQSMLAKRLMFSEELQATVLEVKAISGLGTTIDVILVNGYLKEGDTAVLAGTEAPIVTQIRSLLMPQPLKELRVKNAYVEYKEIKAAQGVKIAAKDLEKVIAGLNLRVAHKPDEVEILKEEVAKELKSALSSIKLQERGVYVQASTLGSLEALLEFLKSSKIPYANIRIGPVVKKDVMKASTMLEHDSQYATILAFDVKIERDAQELADNLGVKIFQADIIYHLFDKFMAYREELKQKKREEFKSIAVFPCKLKILPQFVFNSRDPIVMGVIVEAGIVKEGTPLCVPSKEFVDIGIVTSIEINHKNIDSARKGQEVCIKIEAIPGEAPKMYGRHFDEKDHLVSKISRQSIDACKDYFREDLVKTDWQLMVELKKLFQIL